MQLKLKFDSIEDIKEFSSKTQRLKLQLLQFQAKTINDIAISLTLKRIHDKMRAAGFSQKIIDGTVLASIEIRGPKKVRLIFKSEYFSETGFDVAVAREEGTEDHFIEPISNLSPFIDKPEALHGGDKWPFFSKGHDVSGIVALFIVKTTVKETEEPFQDEYRRRLINWYAANLGGIVVGN